CPVAKSLELVGDRWTLLIVRDLLGGTRRFQDLAASQKGIAPAMLSDRLKRMERHGLVTREFYSEHPPRARYTLTERGRGLGWVVGALAAWGSQHVVKQTRLVHAARRAEDPRAQRHARPPPGALDGPGAANLREGLTAGPRAGWYHSAEPPPC